MHYSFIDIGCYCLYHPPITHCEYDVIGSHYRHNFNELFCFQDRDLSRSDVKMSRFLQGLKLTRERVVIQRVLIRRLDQLTAEERRFLSSDKKFESVLGPPRIRSPFDNPQRVLKVCHSE